MDRDRSFLCHRRGPWLNSIQILPTLSYFLQGGGKNSQILIPLLFGAMPFQTRGLLRKSQKLLRTDGGHTLWYHPGGGGSPTLRSVGAKGTPIWAQRVKWLIAIIISRRLSDLAEILHDDPYEGPQRMESVNVGTGNRIPPLGGVLSNSVLGAYFRCQ